MLTRLREFVRPLAEALGRSLSKIGISPNALTVTGLVFSVLTPVAAILFNPWSSLALMILSAAFDFLDGAVAKATGNISKKGAFLDSFSDRVADAAYILTLKLLGIDWIPAFLFVITAFLISYARARGEALGLKMEGVGLMERGDRIIAIGAALILLCIGYVRIATIIVWVSIALCIITIIHRVAYIVSGTEQ